MRLLLLFCFAALIASFRADGAANRVSAKLISDHDRIAIGADFRVGVLFTIPERAHIYWSNPGDTGLPTELRWDLPDGVETSGLQWPMPSAFEDDVLRETSFAYEHEALVFAAVHPKAGLKPGESIGIRAEVSWLVCLEDGVCIPEDATLSIVLPVAAGPNVSATAAAIFDDYTTRVPRPSTDVAFELSAIAAPTQSLRARVVTPWGLDFASPPQFFPSHGGPWKRIDSPAAVIFEPSAPLDVPVSGALRLSLIHGETREKRIYYLFVGGTPETG